MTGIKCAGCGEVFVYQIFGTHVQTCEGYQQLLDNKFGVVYLHADDVSLATLSDIKQIDDLLSYLATVRHRYGNSAISFSLKWGANSLNDESRECIALIRLLTNQEVSCITIHNANPDFGPVEFMIDYVAGYSDDAIRIEGDNLLDCLQQAHEGRIQ